VYVERGSSGAAPASGARVDRLELAAVEPTTGDVRVLYTYSGCALHLAGELGPDLVVYRVAAAGGADVLLVGRASGRSRLVASIVPMARDFTVDRERGALLYVNRDAKDAALWAVERLDLASGLVTRLATARDDAPAPYALPSSDPVWTAPGRRGLASARGEWLAPLGPGFDAVRATSPDGAWLAVLHVPSEGMDDLALLHAPAGPRGPLGPGGVARLGAGPADAPHPEDHEHEGDQQLEAVGHAGGHLGAQREEEATHRQQHGAVAGAPGRREPQRGPPGPRPGDERGDGREVVGLERVANAGGEPKSAGGERHPHRVHA